MSLRYTNLDLKIISMYDFEKFVQENYRADYDYYENEVYPDEEICYKLTKEPLSKEDGILLENFKNGEHVNHISYVIMGHICKEEKIPEGNYLIKFKKDTLEGIY